MLLINEYDISKERRRKTRLVAKCGKGIVITSVGDKGGIRFTIQIDEDIVPRNQLHAKYL